MVGAIQARAQAGWWPWAEGTARARADGPAPCCLPGRGSVEVGVQARDRLECQVDLRGVWALGVLGAGIGRQGSRPGDLGARGPLWRSHPGAPGGGVPSPPPRDGPLPAAEE